MNYWSAVFIRIYINIVFYKFVYSLTRILFFLLQTLLPYETLNSLLFLPDIVRRIWMKLASIWMSLDCVAFLPSNDEYSPTRSMVRNPMTIFSFCQIIWSRQNLSDRGRVLNLQQPYPHRLLFRILNHENSFLVVSNELPFK